MTRRSIFAAAAALVPSHKAVAEPKQWLVPPDHPWRIALESVPGFVSGPLEIGNELAWMWLARGINPIIRFEGVDVANQCRLASLNGDGTGFVHICNFKDHPIVAQRYRELYPNLPMGRTFYMNYNLLAKFWPSGYGLPVDIGGDVQSPLHWKRTGRVTVELVATERYKNSGSRAGNSRRDEGGGES